MLVCALDTATLTLSVVLVEAGDSGLVVLEEREERTEAMGAQKGKAGGHSARLPKAIAQLLQKRGKTVRDVEGWVVGLGPGSFTGLRIGLASVKGLAYANQRPLAGASSLAAMALAAALEAPPGALLVPLLDAKKNEVYAGFYRASGGRVEAVFPDPPAGRDRVRRGLRGPARRARRQAPGAHPRPRHAAGGGPGAPLCGNDRGVRSRSPLRRGAAVRPPQRGRALAAARDGPG
jgi:tRNA threonylcarbamoyl adenosine modification protein YeaZ